MTARESIQTFSLTSSTGFDKRKPQKPGPMEVLVLDWQLSENSCTHTAELLSQIVPEQAGVARSLSPSRFQRSYQTRLNRGTCKSLGPNRQSRDFESSLWTTMPMPAN